MLTILARSMLTATRLDHPQQRDDFKWSAPQHWTGPETRHPRRPRPERTTK